MREKMSGDKNPAKRPEVRKKISEKRKGNNGRLGIPHSEETKRKMSAAHKGKKKEWAGKFITEEGRKRISESKMGSKNSNWKGGITSLDFQIRNSARYRHWRWNIFKRDNFTCQECGSRSRPGKAVYLEGHHTPKSFSKIVQEYSIKTLEHAFFCKELWDINNGKTLCNQCHSLTKYGRPNN